MPKKREFDDVVYRDILNELDEMFPNRACIKIKDVVAYTGQCYETVKKNYEFDKSNFISKRKLASMLA